MLSLTRWNPWEDLDNLHRTIDESFGRRSTARADRDSSWVPATEVTSDKEGWTVRLALPGVDPKNVEIDLNHNILTVKGERSTAREDAEHHVSEFGYGRFVRSFTLPSTVAADAVGATFEHGMLELRLPMAEASKPRRIEIGAAAPKAA
jgi:HSP20 family protein